MADSTKKGIDDSHSHSIIAPLTQNPRTSILDGGSIFAYSKRGGAG